MVPFNHSVFVRWEKGRERERAERESKNPKTGGIGSNDARGYGG